jgi:predicted PurR-regulated permease PerM
VPLDPSRARIALRIILAVAVVIALIGAGRSLLPFLLGLGLAYVLAGPAERLSRRLPRPLAVSVVFVGTIAFIVLSVRLLVPPLASQIAAFVAAAPEIFAEASRRLEAAGLWWGQLELPPEARRSIEDAMREALSSAGSLLREQLVDVALRVAGVIGFLFGLLVVAVWSFYLVRDRERVLGWLEGVAGAQRADVVAVLTIADAVAGRWLRGQLVLMLAVGIASGLGTFVVGRLVSPSLASFALVLGVIAGVTELFPVIGPILGAIPAVLVAAADEPRNALWVILLYLVIQQLENLILVPKIMGDALSLHPVVLILALVIGGSLFGILGAILAAPLLALGRALYRYTDARLAGHPPDEALAAARPVSPRTLRIAGRAHRSA